MKRRRAGPGPARRKALLGLRTATEIAAGLPPPLFAVVQVRVTGPVAPFVIVKVLPDSDFAATVYEPAASVESNLAVTGTGGHSGLGHVLAGRAAGVLWEVV